MCYYNRIPPNARGKVEVRFCPMVVDARVCCAIAFGATVLISFGCVGILGHEAYKNKRIMLSEKDCSEEGLEKDDEMSDLIAV